MGGIGSSDWRLNLLSKKVKFPFIRIICRVVVASHSQDPGWSYVSYQTELNWHEL